MPDLTEKQKKFADFYLETGNATEAARRAGYAERSAKSIGHENMTKPNIAAYIRARTDARDKARIASADELLEFMSDVVHGKVKDQFGLDATLSDRLKACDSLMRRYDAGKMGELEKEASEKNTALSTAYSNFFHNIGYAFGDAALKVFDHAYTHFDFAGGRGSLKSSFVSQAVVLLVMQTPDAHALVLRKVANTLRDSVYAQYIWAIGQLGVADFWEPRKTPMELIFKPTGQKIMFRGADDPMKIKSIKVPFGFIAITHFEEKDQFAGRSEIRTILQSTMRGGAKFWNFESYNPPISRDNWANKDSLEIRPDRYSHKSTYLEVQNPEWLGEQFLAEAELLKASNERAYQHEYLGEPTGTGGNVFENLEIRELSDDEINGFDRIYNGLDWGYFPDPWAFNRVHFNAARRTLFIFAEMHAYKKGNRDTADMLKESGITHDDMITADSAEPKSIGDYQKYGFRCFGAIKGPDSVRYYMVWLQSLNKIIIDPKRCPNTTAEFREYEYERTKDGEIISEYPDRNNHHIDAVRYATERIWRKRGQ